MAFPLGDPYKGSLSEAPEAFRIRDPHRQLSDLPILSLEFCFAHWAKENSTEIKRLGGRT